MTRGTIEATDVLILAQALNLLPHLTGNETQLTNLRVTVLDPEGRYIIGEIRQTASEPTGYVVDLSSYGENP